MYLLHKRGFCKREDNLEGLIMVQIHGEKHMGSQDKIRSLKRRLDKCRKERDHEIKMQQITLEHAKMLMGDYGAKLRIQLGASRKRLDECKQQLAKYERLSWWSWLKLMPLVRFIIRQWDDLRFRILGWRA